jgi:hypothetical protein
LALLQFFIPTVLAQILVLVIAVLGVRIRPFLIERWGERARPTSSSAVA